jgi:hypothetical protein
VVKRYGRLIVGDQGELMVECADEETANSLSEALSERFGEQVQLAP